MHSFRPSTYKGRVAGFSLLVWSVPRIRGAENRSDSMDRLGNNFHSLSLINTRRHALALSGLASAGRKLQQSPLRPAERLLICSKAGSNCHFGTRFQCEKPPRMHHSKNETSLNLLPAHIYTMQVTVDSKRRLEPADLIQKLG